MLEYSKIHTIQGMLYSSFSQIKIWDLIKKLSLKWHGSYKVLEKINVFPYKMGKQGDNKGDVIHHNRLKPYQGTDKPKRFMQSKS